jgi:nitric oxide reductase activation protein
MTQNLSTRLTKGFGRVVIVLGLIAAASSFAPAQEKQRARIGAPQVSADPITADPRKNREEPLTIAEEEMRAKRAIKEADREYQENLGRARDLSSLGLSIVASFKEKNTLNRDDIKKLDKVEKLAKSIRSAAGGSEDKVEIEKPPKDLASAMNMLADLSQSLKDKVEKTPKHVISAAVIDEANALLELIRIVRNLPAQV